MCSKLCAFLQIARGADCWLVVRNGGLPTRGGSPTRCCFRGGSEPGLLPRLCDTASKEKSVLFGPYQRGPLSMDEGSSNVQRKVEVKGALHEGVQDIGWGRMSRTYCVSVRDRSEDLLKIKHADGFELNGVGVLQMRACKWIGVKVLWSSGMPTRLSLGSLSLVLHMTMKKGVSLPCTNWSGAGAALLMSQRQDETSQYEGICVVWQAGSQENVHVRPPHGPHRCVNE